MSYREAPAPDPLLYVTGPYCAALNPEDGVPLWYYQATQRIVRFGCTGERVYLLDENCWVHCLDRTRGTAIGKVQVGDEGAASALLLRDGRAYVASHLSVSAIEENGRVLWTRAGPKWSYPGAFPLLAGLAIGDAIQQPDAMD